MSARSASARGLPTALVVLLSLVACSRDAGTPGAGSPDATRARLREIEARDWTYSAWFPGAAKTTTRRVPTPAAGTVTQKEESFEDANGAFGVSYTDYPEDYVLRTEAEAILEGAVQGAARGVRARVEENRRTRVSGFPAREMLGVDRGGRAFRSRFVLVGRRLFQVLVATETKRMEEERVRRFFREFRLRPR